MKAYTDLEQSKKLAEILPIDSTDGFYERQFNPTTDKWEYILFTGNEWVIEENIIPCWSLAALFDILPEGTESHKVVGDDSIRYYYIVVYINRGDFSTKMYDNLLDACVEMIYKLKERDLL